MNLPAPENTSGGKHALRRSLVVHAAILAVLAVLVGAFLLVAVPYVQIRTAISRYRTANDAGGEVKDLGGPREAARKLSFYLHLPRWIASDRPLAVALLSDCKADAGSALVDLADDGESSVRMQAIIGLAQTGHAEACVIAIRSLYDADSKVRVTATQILGDIGDKRAIGPLNELLGDDSMKEQHEHARNALEKLQSLP